jgi:uncharacterized membrane protein YsdA (DUF1294 family)
MSPYEVYLIAVTVVGFAVYAWDKLSARSGWWRVPEMQLLGLSLAGGAAGGLAAMLLFRHKTRKLQFFVAQGVGIVLHAALLVA